jgi:tetratricopeptide (TPR) repeat protein
MGDEAVAPAWNFLQKAIALKAGVTEREQAYIDALGKRYVAQPVPDRKELDRAYKEAMEALSKRYPDDLDAAVLYAEAVMVRNPWDYWLKDGSPREFTPPLLANLESVIARDPDHFGAIHLYIHAVEAQRPKLAEPFADRLRTMELVGAGHLVHMPAHIYIRVGRYHDSAIANEEAARADASYVAQCHAQGVYPLAYHPHNYHFLWASVTMEGRSADALKAAEDLRKHTNHELMREMGFGTLQHYAITPVYAMVRFGKWDEILARPKPELLYQEGVWHYARGMALTAKKQLSEADGELGQLRQIAADERLASVTLWDINGVQAILGVAVEHLAGELAAARGDVASAVEHLSRGVQLEDDLRYDEPPPWHMPIRQALGAVLLNAGRAAEAEAVYRMDLEKFPENGWSLYGLMKALEAQGKPYDDVAKRFREAWKYADIELTSSRIG